MHVSLLTALAGSLFIPCALCRASVILENRETLPEGWHIEAEAPLHETLSVSIALAQPGLADLEAHMLRQTSSQTSPPSSTHLLSAQLAAYQAPHSDAARHVLSWLADNGVHDTRADGPWVRLNATVDALQKLFEADMAYYAYRNSTTTVLRAPSYSVPVSLAEFVDFVFPLAHFMPPADSRQSARSVTKQRKKKMSRIERRQSWGGGWGGWGGWEGRTNSTFTPWPYVACLPGMITPGCIRQMYNWPMAPTNRTSQTKTTPSAPPATSAPQSQVRLGIAGFLGQNINHQDVTEFLQIYAPGIAFQPPGTPAYNFSIALVNNGTNIQSPRFLAGMEASLDVQYSMALAFPSQVTFYNTGGRAEKLGSGSHHMDPRSSNNEPYLDLLEYLVRLPDDTLPHVLSISYSDDEQSVPQPYAMRVCQLFLQLTARGTSVLVATGDGGSHGISSACIYSDSSLRHSLIPTFPASCPWVTAVGSTEDMGPGAPGTVSPTIAADYSSGGFSNYFSRPAWQNDTVNTYIGLLGDNKVGLYNRSGRAIPDISAVGSHFSLIWGGVFSSTDGTSASTPVVASMVAAINDQRLRAGKHSLGWLNPTLYSSSVQSTLQDITIGISKGCLPLNHTAWASGWPAAEGWDAITGQGVPNNFTKFAAALLQA